MRHVYGKHPLRVDVIAETLADVAQVASGDYCAAIATKFNITVNQIEQFNNKVRFPFTRLFVFRAPAHFFADLQVERLHEPPDWTQDLRVRRHTASYSE